MAIIQAITRLKVEFNALKFAINSTKEIYVIERAMRKVLDNIIRSKQ